MIMEEPQKDTEKEKNFVASIIELISLLLSVDINSVEAKLNETSISDNNGGRILL